MKDHEQLKEGSQATSRKDERNNNKRAKEDHPEAPEPVIGMNEERGGVSSARSQFQMPTLSSIPPNKT
jgi:hypothetical protein